MIHRLADFVFILLFVWACMLLGFWVIDSFIVPFELPGTVNGFLTGMLKVAVSSALVLLWLWLWREIVKLVFWRSIREQQDFIKSGNNNSKMEDALIEPSEKRERDEP